MQRYISNPPSRAIAPTVGSRSTDSNKPRNYDSGNARWVKRSAFNCLTGHWSGEPFDIDPHMVMHVTEFMAIHDGEAIITLWVRTDGSDSKVSYKVDVPNPSRVGRA